MTLYQLTAEMKALLDMMETEEVPEDVLRDTLESVEGDFEEKIDNCVIVIKELEDDAEKCRAEKKRLDARIKADERNVLRLKNMITSAAIALGKKNIKTEHYTLNRFNAGKLDVYGTVPDTYTRQVQTVRKEIDKDAIKSALDNGESLSFARYISSCTIK